MIITKTPYRVSFFGGGTDYPEWYLREGGAVLSTALDKYCYISCRRLPAFFDLKHRIVWSHIETVSTISEILHPAVREGLRYLGFDDSTGIEIHHQGDLPARAGMGSSGSFSVGLIHALLALRGELVGKHELALRAIDLEQNVLGENVGSQDQVAAAYGGLNVIEFHKTGEIRVSPVTISQEKIAELESRLLLVYTGSSRLASEVAGTVVRNFSSRRTELRAMRTMVDEAWSILGGSGPLDSFGKLLHESWMLKRKLSACVTTPLVDGIYETALEHGALGGKLLGAGSAGFMLLYLPPHRRGEVTRALDRYVRVPFRFENAGSSIIHYSPSSPAALEGRTAR